MEDSLLTEAILPGAIALVMCGLGLSLRPADFRRLVTYPRGIAIGICNLAVIAPCLAFGLAEAFGLPPGLAIGLVLLGASPGGAMANMLTHWARGDTALSVSMTGISSLGAVVTVPVYLGLASAHFGGGYGAEVEMLGIVARVLAITILPIAAGMTIRHWAPGPVERAGPAISRLTMALFAVMVISVLAFEGMTVINHGALILAACATLNLGAMSISFGIAKLSRLSDAQATAIAMELGIHNAMIAIAVGATISTTLTVPAAVYAGFMLLSASGFAVIMGRRNASAAGPAATPGEDGTPGAVTGYRLRPESPPPRSGQPGSP